jgi:YfiH family protein
VKFERIIPDWPAPAQVRAFSTTRIGGVSTGPWAGFNLGGRCGDEPDNVLHNRKVLNRDLPSPVRWLQQVHGQTVWVYSHGDNGEMEADAAVSFRPGEVCAVLTADCLPVFFCNEQGDRVGIAHAGWRGLAAGVLVSTIRALDENPASLMAWLGPAIGPAVYEVGPEVAESFRGEREEAFVVREDRYLMDIYAVARMKLEAAGVRSISGGGFCTFSEPDRFYSFRRDGITGRMAHLIWIDS